MKSVLPTIEQVINKAKKYKRMGLTQQEAISLVLKEIRAVEDAQRISKPQ